MTGIVTCIVRTVAMGIMTVVGFQMVFRLDARPLANVDDAAFTLEVREVTHLPLRAPFEGTTAPQVQQASKKNEDEDEMKNEESYCKNLATRSSFSYTYFLLKYNIIYI